ncbi:glycosyltransferase family 39 protein [Streptomyces sp. 2P-4]|uniref:glycosyltransferase family 39 protein n=1 Tax=Streptomyces sp. 2P-4 TaxID=2931974 RepID=UPI002540E031|nr:glycosyltransferase family 39 protein [Streptomyces sp. 2P-4]
MTSAVPPLHAPPSDRAAAPDSTAGRGTAAPAVPRPRWELPALGALLAATAALLLWNLGASGYANSFYSAAAQAGSESWKAFFFGSSDAGNSITVDKPPAALWPMALSVRLFGLGSWQLLVPQALMGVATTAVLYAAVRRHFGPAAALLSGTVFALTPVAALMFRFNNPDALLTLLLTATVYCVLRALDGARTGWLVAAGAVAGLAFLTKTLQAFVILPPLALLYALCAPARLRRRLGQLLAAGAAMAVAGGWWVAVVELWPASSRPYIGGSQTNSFLELTLGYNGLGRINGNETGSVGGGRPGGGGGWGETGIERLFSAGVGGQASWLLPAALAMLAAGLVITWKAARPAASVESAARAAFLAWGGPLLLTAAVFSSMRGIFHEYYTVALAPFTAALVGMGVALLWEERGSTAAAAALSGTLALTAWWSWVLLGRSPDFLPWLRWAVLAAGLGAAAGLFAGARQGRRFTRAAAALGLAAALAGPFAYCLATVASPHTGSIPKAGPAVAGAGPGGRRAFEGADLPQGAGPQGAPVQGMPGGMPGRDGRTADGRMLPGGPGGATAGPGGPAGGAGGPRGGGPGGPGGAGGLLNGTKPSGEAVAALRAGAGAYTWAAAVVGAQNAAGYQLASGEAVMPVGGFNGSDPSPTLEQFREYVRSGRIHYFIGSSAGPAAGEGAGMRRGGGPGGATSSAITEWVEANFTATTVGGAVFYDLTAPATAASGAS